MKMNKSLICASIALVVAGGLLAGCSKSDDTAFRYHDCPCTTGQTCQNA